MTKWFNSGIKNHFMKLEIITMKMCPKKNMKKCHKLQKI